MSHKATDWAWEQPVRGVRQHVLLALAARANVKTRQCSPSMAELRARTGLAENTIREHIKALVSDGYVAADVSNGGRRKRSTYTILIDRVTTETPQEVKGFREGQTPQEADRSEAETPQELRINPSGDAPVVLRTKTRTREPVKEADAAAPPPADAALFDEPVTPQTIKRDRSKIGHAIAKRYCELEPFSKYPAVLGIVNRALASERFSGEEIMSAVERLAREQRSLTLETLRVELVGFVPRTNGSRNGNRTPLRERLKGGAA